VAAIGVHEAHARPLGGPLGHDQPIAAGAAVAIAQAPREDRQSFY
jgi:hypothetical protein